ncbi:hypothetical protein FBR05_03210 [Deltaproteobacteria bacterium PRO3]|nr:hypothetical protein [Deltaproteobacteria bacterium PRO3]
MYEKLTIRIRKIDYEILQVEAAKSGLSKAELVRRLLENFQLPSQKFAGEDLNKFSECKAQEALKSTHLLIQENNLLLRKIARYTNTQIVIETDEQMNQKFGQDFKKNVLQYAASSLNLLDQGRPLWLPASTNLSRKEVPTPNPSRE